MENRHKFNDSHTLQHRYADRGEQDLYHRLSSGIIFISLTAIVPTGFASSSMRVKSYSTSMIWNRKSAMLSPVRSNFGSKPTAATRKLSSAVMLRRCSVWRTASSIWREKRCLSVWFIFEDQRLCLRVQPFYYL